MKDYKVFSICLIIFATSCAREYWGADRNFPISKDLKFSWKEGDTLTYKSGSNVEKYCVFTFVTGHYNQTHSGTCSKGVVDCFEFQAIYIKPIDSSSINMNISTSINSCSPPPKITHDYISIVKNLVNIYDKKVTNYDASICWFNEFEGKESSFTKFYSTITINGKEFTHINLYTVTNNVNGRVQKLYYSKTLGFIAYELKNGDVYSLYE